MKLLSSIVAVAFLIASGCSSITPEQRLAALTAAAHEAALVGSQMELSAHPDQRPAFAATVQLLNGLIQDGQYSPGKFSDALAGLRINELRGETGAIILGGIVTLYTAATGFVDILNQGPAELKPIVTAVRDGLNEGLAATKGGTALGTRTFRLITIPKR